MKLRQYGYPPMIDVCRNCGGTGLTSEASLFRDKGGTCPVCEGSGRVVKKKSVTLVIEPYECDH
jgi:hypothetical protein